MRGRPQRLGFVGRLDRRPLAQAVGKADDLSPAPTFCPPSLLPLGQWTELGRWAAAGCCASPELPPGCILGTVKSPRLKGVQ